MAVDRTDDSTDASVEADENSRDQDRHPPPDRPGAEGAPSRAESRAAAAAANKDAAQTSDQASAPISNQADSFPRTTESSEIVTEVADAKDEHDGADIPSAIGATDRDSPGTARVESDSETDPAVDIGQRQGILDRLPALDRPSAESSPGTAETVETDSIAWAESRAGGQIEGGGFRAISGEGLSDDTAHAADLADPEVETGLLERLKQVAEKLDRDDSPREICDIVDRPDFQDPRESLDAVPDRYGRPLDRPDGTRTPLFNGEPTREQAQQGRLKDCGIISTLGAVAGHHPEAIRNCVSETDDGNYEVRLNEAKFSISRLRYEPTGRTITLTVTPELPVFDNEPGKPAFADSNAT